MKQLFICFTVLLIGIIPVFSKDIRNIDGTVITVPDNVERVAALFGPSYEKLFMLGVEDEIIADGDFHISGWPWSNRVYKRLEDVKGIPNAHNVLNIEEVLRMKPDVVFYWDNPPAVKKMGEVGITAIPAVSTGKLEDTKNMLKVYSQVFGNRSERIASDYARYFDEKLKYVKKITSQISSHDRPRVYMASQKILWTYGKNSDMTELVELAGGICVHKDVDGNSKVEISPEQLIKWDPDYIFVDHAGSSGNASAEDVIKESSLDGRLNDISAFKNDGVVINPTGVFFWDSGVQKILLLMFVAKTIHPDRFKSFDMRKELKYFYKKFFRYELTVIEVEKILKHENP